MNLLNKTVSLDYDCCRGGQVNDTTLLFDVLGNSTGGDATLDPRPQWVFLSLIVIPVWMLGGNLLVLLAVLYQRNLQNLSNRVIASLAFTDLLLGLVVVPLSIYQLVQGKWVLGFSVCLMWTGSDVILSTASIMHLCAIALYRYHGIAHPLHVRSYATQGRRVTALVVPAWTISVALSIPFIVQGIIDPSYVLQPLVLSPQTSGDTGEHSTSGSLLSEHVQCGIFNQTFAIYSSLVSFFIPLAIMIFADIRSIQILRKNIKLPLLLNYGYIQPRRLACKSPVEDLGETTLDSPEDSVRASDATSSHSPPITRQLVATITMTSQYDAMATGKVMAYDGGRNGASSELELLRSNSSSRTTPCTGSGPPTGGGDPAPNKPRSRSRSMVYLDMLASCGKAKVNGRERRAEKTLIWVFASFIVLWLPFFCINLAYGLCGDRCSIPGELFQVFTWLGYLSSGVNPCIYTLLNKDFRTAFRNLLLCRHEQLTRTAHSFGPMSTSNGTLRGLVNTP